MLFTFIEFIVIDKKEERPSPSPPKSPFE